jgi:hypothetical protein
MEQKPMVIGNTTEIVGKTLVDGQECCQALHKFRIFKLGDLWNWFIFHFDEIISLFQSETIQSEY